MFLDGIRISNKNSSITQQLVISIGIAIGGFLLGVIQKWIDALPSNALPIILQKVDIGNYFGRLAIWILLATIISIYATSPFRASINTFIFLISMLAGYYLYCYFVLGFLPLSYMIVWIIISIISIFIAFICWYAKGNGIVAVIISSGIIGVLFSQAFLITQGFYVTHILEVITWIVALIILRREPKEFVVQMGLSFVVSIIYQLIIPYWG